jgi:hypothetical protein
MPGQQGNNQAKLPEVEHGKAAAEGPHWSALGETFATTPQEAQAKLDSIVQANPKQHEDKDYRIYSPR